LVKRGAVFVPRGGPDASGEQVTKNFETAIATSQALGGLSEAVAAIASLVRSEVIAVALVEIEHGKLRFANSGFCRLFGWSGGMELAAIGDLVDPADREYLETAVHDGAGQHVTCVAKGVRKDGANFGIEFRFYPLIITGHSLCTVFAEDVTHREQFSIQLRQLAYSDPLTGLPNRAALVDRLRQAILSARYASKRFAVLALDLDHFKPVNDRLGHAAGDFTLQRIAQRLLASLHDSDTVARNGGDEFTILLPSVQDREAVEAIAERLINAVRLPIKWEETEIQVGVSVGMAMFPDHANAVDRLLAAADSALYAAKEGGRGGFAWAVEPKIADLTPPPLLWNAAHELGIPEMDEQHRHLAELLNGLGHALQNAEPYEELLQQLIRYTEFHFASEESLMRGCQYSGMMAHTAVHRQLLDDLRKLDLSGAINVSLLLCFLQEWLVGHIQGADRDLAITLLAQRQAAGGVA
jgi:diguanylate cyclase (GGDEF)-like protein/hemerythrin-like metal-binding protein